MDGGAWLTAGIGTAAVVVGVTIATGVVVGLALASYGDMRPWLTVLVSVTVPVLGPLALAGVAAVRGSRLAAARSGWRGLASRSMRAVPLAGRRNRLLLLAVSSAAILALLGLPVAQVRTRAAFKAPVALVSLPGGAPLLAATTVGLLLVGALALRRPTRLGAVVAAHLASAWIVLASGVLLVAAPLTAVLALANRTVGSWATGLVLAALRRTDAPSAGAVDSVRASLSTQLGPGVWVALAGAVLLLAWSAVEVAAAARLAGPSEVRAAPPATVPPAASDRWTF